MSRARGTVTEVGRISAIVDRDAYPDFDLAWLEQGHWRANGARVHSSTGRGSVLMLDHGGETWVLRHYHRGGLVARLVFDHYLWTGRDRTRPFREWRLLDSMIAEALPVPRPVAARAIRTGPIYQADIVTVLLPATRPLSALLVESRVEADAWPRIGEMLRRFHDAGIDHPDLTAHNILVDDRGAISLVDFDNAVRRPIGPWCEARMARLRRSLRKVALETGTRYRESAWKEIAAGYRGSSA